MEGSSGFPHSGETLLSSSLRCNHRQPTFFPSLNLATHCHTRWTSVPTPPYLWPQSILSLRKSHRVKLPQPILIPSPKNPIASHGAVRFNCTCLNLSQSGHPRSSLTSPLCKLPSPTELRAGRAFDAPDMAIELQF